MSDPSTIEALLTAFYRAFAGHPDELAAVLSPDWEDLPAAPGQLPGPGGARPIIDQLARALGDLEIVVHEVIATDEVAATGSGPVAVRAEIRGVHRDTLLGAPASGRPVSIALHEFHDLENGRITRTRHLEDWYGFLRQVDAPMPAG
jgi:steroid delta-isomerase-like uncharacterized protein